VRRNGGLHRRKRGDDMWVFPHILNLSTRKKSVVTLTPRPVLPRERRPVAIIETLGGFRYGRFRATKKTLLSKPGFKRRIFRQNFLIFRVLVAK